MNDIHLQLKSAFERLTHLDNSRRNMLGDMQAMLTDIRLKENRQRVDSLEHGL